MRLLKELNTTGNFNLRVSRNSILSGSKPGGKKCKGEIKVTDNSSLSVGKNFSFDAQMHISGHSEVIIADDCSFRNVTIDVSNHSKVIFGNGVIYSSGPVGTVPIQVDNGTLIFGGFNRFMGEILVRFGGEMKIGKYTGIGYNSEIRCEESITIGNYGLFSYGINIFDTDTHSTDWKKRRERLIAGYPVGTHEIEKPNTKPVVIGDDVWLGKGVTITKGTRIGNRCIVGIGTVIGGGEYDDDTTIVSDKPRIISRKK
jgi:acetyltransferase-like isoleucine patch superfamily enzyme